MLQSGIALQSSNQARAQEPQKCVTCLRSASRALKIRTPASAREIASFQGVVLDRDVPITSIRRNALHTQAATVGGFTDNSGKPLACVSVLDSGAEASSASRGLANALSWRSLRVAVGRSQRYGVFDKTRRRGFVAPKLVQVAKSTFERVLAECLPRLPGSDSRARNPKRPPGFDRTLGSPSDWQAHRAEWLRPPVDIG